jgi:hypothetical protein
MVELSRRRPPSPSAEQCAQEARGHLVPAAPKSTQSRRGAAPTARAPCSSSSSAQRREHGMDERDRASACARSA